jgi:glycosyltransferase involved in cell wall biosynthesis
MALVSILLPFRNSAHTLDAAISSIVEQSFDDRELVLIDNASTDESPSIGRRWAGNEPRIRVLHEPRIGIAHALNTGLAHAEGGYIARMDADDISHPERLAEQVATLDAYPEIGVLGTRTAFASSVQESRGMQAFVEAMNGLLQQAKRAARGFRTSANFIAIAYLRMSKLKHLPASPFVPADAK